MSKAMSRRGTFRLRGNQYLYFLCFFCCFMILLYKIEAFFFGSILSQSREIPFFPSLSGYRNTHFQSVDEQFWSDVSKFADSKPKGLFFGFDAILTKEEISEWHVKRRQYLIKETDFFRSRNETPFMPPITDQYLSYLKPTNTFYQNSSIQYMSAATRYAIEDIIRTGFNLERHDSGWRENGIVYRPKGKFRPPSGVQRSDDYDYEAHVYFEESLFFQGRNGHHRDHSKIILWHSPSSYTSVIPNLEPLNSCPYFPCRVTTDRTVYQNSSSAIIFPAENIKGYPPRRTTPDQVFIFHNTRPYLSTERESKDFSKSAWKSVFNWTLSYRLDSDIVLPFGVVRKRPQPLKAKNYDKILAKKKGLVAFFASNCITSGQREMYVENLQKFIPVHVIGKCGNFTCEKSLSEYCANRIAKEYKFILAFESALCPDYVTERMFYYLRKDIVVVARGSNDYFLHVPSETFINTNNFPSPRMLAKTLLYLNKNNDAYINLLRAKDKYMVMFEEHPIRNPSGKIERTEYLFSGVPMCQICQRLWNLDIYSKKINDIHDWFDRKICRFSTDLSFLKYYRGVDLI